MTLSEIIKHAVREAGGDRLCNVGLGCDCGIDYFAPCGSMIIGVGECEIAKSYIEGDGEEWFVPLRREDDE